MPLFQTKSIDQLIADADEPSHRLKRSLGPWALAFLGVGIVIGSGIFTVTGTAASGKLKDPGLMQATVLDILMHGRAAASALGRPGAGPAIVVSFLLVLVACLLAGLCFAELASMIPAGRQHLHLRVRDPGRNFRVDHRLGSDSRIRGRQHVGRGGFLGVSAGPGRQSFRHPSACGDRVSDVCRARIAGRNLQRPRASDHHGGDLGAGARRTRKRAIPTR